MGEGGTLSRLRPWLRSNLIFVALGLGTLSHCQGGEGRGGRELSEGMLSSSCRCVIVKEGRAREGTASST